MSRVQYKELVVISAPVKTTLALTVPCVPTSAGKSPQKECTGSNSQSNAKQRMLNIRPPYEGDDRQPPSPQLKKDLRYLSAEDIE